MPRRDQLQDRRGKRLHDLSESRGHLLAVALPPALVLSREDFDLLRTKGLSDQEILDVVVLPSANTCLTFPVGDAAGVE
jgi:hypothetical protein